MDHFPTGAPTSFLSEVLEPALMRADSRMAESQIRNRIRELGREALEQFQILVSKTSGRDITKKQFALVAGYRDTTELERWLRDDKRTTRTAQTKIERVLLMPPSDFLCALDEAEPKVRQEALSVQQVGRLLKSHEDTVHRWIRSGKIKANKIGGAWRVPRDEVKRLRATPRFQR